MSDRKKAVDILERFAFALEVGEGASQPARAYASAARTVRLLEGDLRELRASGALEKVRGLGKSAMRAVDAALAGQVPEELVALEAAIPEGLFAVRRVRGLGPAKIRALHLGLGITSLGELEQACQENRLVTLKGFGDKTQAKVLEGIAAIRATEGLYHRHRAAEAVRTLRDHLTSKGVRAIATGTLRRGHELITDPGVLAQESADIPMETVLEGAPRHDVPVRLEWAPAARFGVRALALTSSPEHFAALQAHAATRAMALSEEALTRDGQPCATEHESDVYEALGLLMTEAERREPGVPLVERGKATPKLVTREDLRGALHNHTTASDGSASLVDMRDAAGARGLTYLGITEHSQSAEYARGLSEAKLREQISQITKLRSDAGACVLLTGVESDILPDGALDYEGALLAQLEVVVASVHRRHGLDREGTTKRMLGAVRHPATDIVGHPTGRLLLGRAPNDFDMEAVLDAAAERGCAMELNSSPHRLDLSAEHLAMAKERGVLISIAADAHAVHELDWLDHGVAVARRAGLTAEDVLNARSLEELREWLSARRAKAAALPA